MGAGYVYTLCCLGRREWVSQAAVQVHFDAVPNLYAYRCKLRSGSIRSVNQMSGHRADDDDDDDEVVLIILKECEGQLWSIEDVRQSSRDKEKKEKKKEKKKNSRHHLWPVRTRSGPIGKDTGRRRLHVNPQRQTDELSQKRPIRAGSVDGPAGGVTGNIRPADAAGG